MHISTEIYFKIFIKILIIMKPRRFCMSEKQSCKVLIIQAKNWKNYSKYYKYSEEKVHCWPQEVFEIFVKLSEIFI